MTVGARKNKGSFRLYYSVYIILFLSLPPTLPLSPFCAFREKLREKFVVNDECVKVYVFFFLEDNVMYNMYLLISSEFILERVLQV